MSNYLAAPYKTNDGNQPNLQAVLPNQFYLGPSGGANAVPTFRAITANDINVPTADGIGAKMTSVGADDIASTMSTVGAYIIGENLGIATTGGTALVPYTTLVNDVYAVEEEIVTIDHLMTTIDALNIILESQIITLDADLIGEELATIVATFGTSGFAAGILAIAESSETGAAALAFASLVTDLHTLGITTNDANNATLATQISGISTTLGSSGSSPITPNFVLAGPPTAPAGTAAMRYLVNADIPYNATSSFNMNTNQALAIHAYTTIPYISGSINIGSTGITQTGGTFTNSNSYTVYLNVSFTTFFDNTTGGGTLRAHRLNLGGNFYGSQQCSLQFGAFTGTSSSCRIQLANSATFTIEAYADVTGAYTYSGTGAVSNVILSVC